MSQQTQNILSAAHNNQAGGPASEEAYELPPFVDVFDAVQRAQRKANIQDTLQELANQGYYVVRKRK